MKIIANTKSLIQEKGVLHLGLAITCFLYAATKIAFYEHSKYLDFLLGASLIYFFFNAKDERKSLPVKMLLITLVYLVIAWLVGTSLHPDIYSNKLSLHQMLKIYIFIIIAYFLLGDFNKNIWILSLSAIGLLLTPFTLGGGLNEIKSGLSGVRVDFGIQNAQHTSLLFGVAVIASLAFVKRASKNIFHLTFTLLILAASSIGFLVSNTRTAIIAMLFVLIFYGLYKIVKTPNNRKFKIATITLLAIFLFGYIATPAWKKINKEYETIEQQWNGEVTSISRTSFGARINSWKAGLEWIAKSPIIGWGPKGGFVVAENTEWLKGKYSSTFGHMHSSYFEVLVRYGVIGFALLFYLHFWLVLQIRNVYKAGLMPKDLATFCYLFFIYWAIVNITESYLFYWTGHYVFIIISAIITGYYFKLQQLKAKEEQ